MGLNIGKMMQDQLNKTQEFMIQQGQLTMDRQGVMQAEMFRKQAAIGVARAQDTALWFGSFTLCLAFGATAAFAKTKNKVFFGLLLPTTFITCYWIDLGYLNKMKRISSTAEDLLKNHKTIALPGGALNFKEIEANRLGKN
ncbi:Stem/progenitor cells protein [Oopsacas minuta]|uniref:Stem/progenitor cells protein n=1 Tax=Oopsacas minuta TaxID=111878 RepID=A0AAV7JSJ4_9METZ|nr:Stem/progenitor cells protein [Oopsacas minuta]